jgi:hypothetical protein
MGTSEMTTKIRTSGCEERKVDDSGALGQSHISEAALVRTIDWHIVPTLFLAYFLQFLDKVAINVRYK